MRLKEDGGGGVSGARMSTPDLANIPDIMSAVRLMAAGLAYLAAAAVELLVTAPVKAGLGWLKTNSMSDPCAMPSEGELMARVASGCAKR